MSDFQRNGITGIQEMEFLWRITGGTALSRLLEETLEIHPKTSLKDFNIPIVLATGRLHRSDQSGTDSSAKEQLIMKKSANNAKPKIIADSMTLTCSSCNRPFRARISLNVFIQINHIHI